MPLNLANPAWVDAEPDLNKHIVEIKLPKAAMRGDGLAELQAQVAALHPVLLDRKRPLWKFHVFEGLAPAANGHKRVAMYTQLHHAAVDGQAAVALANAILDVTPEPRAIEAAPSKRARTFKLDMAEMLRGALANQIAQLSSIVKELPTTAATLGGAARSALGGTALLGGKGKAVSNLTLAPKTPFNVSITPGRAFAAVTLPLRELKALGKAHEATINDMVLMVCSTALRRYFAKKRMLPRKSLVAAVPISLREAGDTASDNQASMSLISLGTNVADAGQRLAHIKAATSAMKRTMGSVKSILPTDFPSLGVPWLIEAATALYGKAKVADRIPQVANVVISNVPGPPVPLYMAGARMITNYPASIIVHGMALNITVQSYDQSLDFGLMADAQAMPDVQDFARAIEIAFDDVRTLPLPEDVAAEQAAAQGGMVQRAARGAARAVSGAVGGAVAGVVRGAVRGAVRQAVQGAVAGAVRGAAKRAVAGARADPSKSKPKSTPAPKPAPVRRARGTVKR
jgi:diacylglycerol O-acyltransferase / wax synthase